MSYLDGANFSYWLHDVDVCLLESSLDDSRGYSDFDYRDAWASGLSPEDCAEAVLELYGDNYAAE